MTRSKSSGLSLVETLIATSLFAVVAALLSTLFASAMRNYGRTSERVHLMQMGTVAVEKLRSDLGQATVEGVTILNPSSERQLVVVQKVRDVTSSGAPVLADELIIFQWNEGRLTQSFYEAPTPGTISGTYRSPTLSDVETYLLTARTKVLASQVTFFHLQDANPALPTLELPLDVTIRLNQEVVNGVTPGVVDLNRKIFLRNG